MTNLTTQNRASRISILLAFAAIYLIWGSTYLAIRFAIETLPPFLMTGVRFLIGGIILYLWGRSQSEERLTPSHWRSASIVGLLLVVGGTAMVSWAEKIVPSGLAALMIAAVPLWITLVDWLRPSGVRPTNVGILGLIVGFAGILILIDPFESRFGSAVNLLGALVLLVAALSWSTGSILSRHVPLPSSRILGAGMEMIIGGIALLGLGSLVGELGQVQMTAISLRSVASLIYLSLFGSLAFAAYVWLLKASTPARASTYAFVNPVVAVILGSLLAGEELTVRTVVAAVVIITAVVVIVTQKAKSTPVPLQDEVERFPGSTAAVERE